MSDDSEALIREIEEEVRREKLTKLWNQYGTLLLGGVAALVFLVGGWQWYVAYQLDRTQTAGAQFQESLQLLQGDKKPDGLAGLEQIAKEGTPAYATLAKLRLAAEHREAGKADKAIELYTEIANDTSAGRIFSSFASLQVASLKIDSGTWTEVENRLNELADESSPWRYTARELLGLAAFKHERWSKSREAYTALLADPQVPQTMKQRAQVALSLITREQAATKTDTTKGDLKKDKSAADAAKSTAGGAKTKSTSASSDGAGAKNDAKKTE